MNYKQEIKKNFLSLRTLFSFFIALVIICILLLNINFLEIINIIKRVYLFYYLVAFLLFYIAIIIRNFRWQLQLKNIGYLVPYFKLFRILMVSYFTNCIIPAKLGDFMRGYMIRKRYKGSFTKTMGSVFTERLIDIILLVAMLTISGSILFGKKLNKDLIFALIVGYIIILILFIFLFILRIRTKFVKYIPKKIMLIIDQAEEGIIGSIKKKNFTLILLYSVLIWLCEITSLYFIFISLELNISYFLSVFIALSAALLTAIPITPGGLGAVESAIVGILIMFSIDKNIGISTAILQRFINYISVLILGGFIALFGE